MIRIKELGFDHIRLPIDEVQFWDEQGNRLDDAWQLLTNALEWCCKHNLRVIVDLHTLSVRERRLSAVFLLSQP